MARRNPQPRYRRHSYIVEFGFAPTHVVSLDTATGARRGGSPATAGAFTLPRPFRMFPADQSGISTKIAFDHAASYASASTGFPGFCASDSGGPRSFCLRLELAVGTGRLRRKLHPELPGDLENAYRRTTEPGGNTINTELGLAQLDQLPILLHRPFAHRYAFNQPPGRCRATEIRAFLGEWQPIWRRDREGSAASRRKTSRTSPTVFIPA